MGKGIYVIILVLFVSALLRLESKLIVTTIPLTICNLIHLCPQREIFWPHWNSILHVKFTEKMIKHCLYSKFAIKLRLNHK
jgi:hypothetical protein